MRKALVVWKATRRSANRSWDSNFLAIVNVARLICARSYHFVIAVWRAKEHNRSRKLLEYYR
jgi:hypothetical protein